MDMHEKIEMSKFLFNKKIITHIDTHDGSFYNGLIMELSDTMLVINDRKIGDTPIMLSNIKNLSRWRD